MARRPADFSLIQILLALIVVGVLIGLAVVRFKRMKEDSVVATLSSDLTAIAALEAAFAERYHDYAGAAIPSGTPDTSGSGAGRGRSFSHRRDRTSSTSPGVRGVATPPSPATLPRAGNAGSWWEKRATLSTQR
jgi:Tfp pilus assembly protein PilE